jgi:hypothetical protein
VVKFSISPLSFCCLTKSHGLDSVPSIRLYCKYLGSERRLSETARSGATTIRWVGIRLTIVGWTSQESIIHFGLVVKLLQIRESLDGSASALAAGQVTKRDFATIATGAVRTKWTLCVKSRRKSLCAIQVEALWVIQVGFLSTPKWHRVVNHFISNYGGCVKTSAQVNFPVAGWAELFRHRRRGR